MQRFGGTIGRVLVLGLGKSGKSVARYCADLLGSRVDSLFIAAGAQTDDSAAFLESLPREGVAWAFGDDALAQDRGRFDLCIASPGIPFWHDLYVGAQRCSDAVISEVEFAWRESDPASTWVAITGTNGKTTTTSLAAHVLRSCGMAASPVGNIGDVCLDAVAAGGTDVYVAEVSSYQLHSTSLFAPDVAVVLNITPDHVHWHRSFEAYALAKFNVLRRGGSDCACAHPVAILDATDDVVRAKVRELRASGEACVPVGTAAGLAGDMRARCGADNAAFLADDGSLVVAYGGREHRLGTVSDLQLKGAHNAGNALMAASVAVVLGADDLAIAEALASFAPLEHRIEPCGAVCGVECYNDSKATNVDASCKALSAFSGRRVAVLLGGDDKGTDLSELVEQTCAHAFAAVCFGAAAERFAQAFEEAPATEASGLAVVRAGNLESALDAALEVSREGDVVLLSPACASFDEFSSFEERGRVFKRLVADRRASADALRRVPTGATAPVGGSAQGTASRGSADRRAGADALRRVPTEATAPVGGSAQGAASRGSADRRGGAD